MVTLVVVDHHHSDYVDRAKVDLPTFGSEEEFISALHLHLSRDYDLVLSDADPDGYLSALVYCLNRQSTNANFKCFRVPLTKDHIEILKKNNIHTIIAFDWFPLYGSDLSLFDKVTLLNPVYSRLFENTSTSELVYRASAHKTPFMRDLNAIGVVSDYGMKSGMNTVVETIQAYPELFTNLKIIATENKLNRTNVFDSRFKELSELFWAPYIIYGEQGAQELVRLILSSRAFTYDELFDFAHHPAIEYLWTSWHDFNRMMETERRNYDLFREETGDIIIYTPQVTNPGFIQKFSSVVSDHSSGKIILMKISVGNKTKYSARQKGLLIDLGRIFHDMGVGGGHATAAGALVDDPELFERQFMQRISRESAT